jgi:cytoskeletal protein CcmA (bactofilin family)
MEMGKLTETVQDKRTIVEEGTTFKGTMESSCPVLVNGRIEGDLKAPSMIVSSAGAVQGVARVGTLQSQGELSGEFEADRVELAGTVKDKTVIRAQTLEMKLGSQRGKMQVIFGESESAATAETTKAPPTRTEARPSRPPAALRPSQPPPS